MAHLTKSVLACASTILICSAIAQGQTVSKKKPELPSATASQAAASTGGNTATFDHLNGSMKCGDRISAAGCRVIVDEGDLVGFQVINSVPGLLSVDVKKTDKTPDALALADFQKLTGKVPGASTAKATERGGTCPDKCDSSLTCYRHIVDALERLNRAIASNLSDYGDSVCALAAARDAFLTQLSLSNPEPVSTVSNAFFAALTADQKKSIPSEADFQTFWTQLTALLKVAPDDLAAFTPYTVEYSDRDFDLDFSFKSLNPLIQAPDQSGRVQVRLKNGWRIATATALMASGLVDDDFTIRTVSTTTNGQTVTRKTAVAEDKNRFAPEIAFLVNLIPKPPSAWGRTLISVGVGLSTETAGRMYATLGYRFGQAGAFHIGMAAGKVKRLSNNVNVDDLGDTDPQASRRDVMRVSWTIGISWRIAGQ